MIIKGVLVVMDYKATAMQLNAVIPRTLYVLQGVVRNSVVEADSNLSVYDISPSIAPWLELKSPNEEYPYYPPVFSTA